MELGSEDEDTRLEDSPREQSTVPSSRSPSVLSSAHEEELEPVPTRSAQHRDVVMEFPTPARSPAEPTTNSPISYSLAVSQRQSRFRLPSNAPPKSYAIESVYSISTSTQVHALALPPCASHLYVGGADGLVRRYAIHPMLNCLRSDNLPSNNLTMKPGGSVPPAPDTKFPVLVAYWENEEPGTWQNTIRENVAFGTKNVGLADRVSVVHSLAVQSEELWGLSGTAVRSSLCGGVELVADHLPRRKNGSINLYTIRHDEGQIRHVFPSSTNATMGHRPNSAVSVLTLIEDEKSVLSGGWDHSILVCLRSLSFASPCIDIEQEWDLNTGLARRQYEAHTGQISTLEFRPLTPPVPTSPSLSASSSTGVAASLVNNPTNGRASSPKSDEAFDPLFDSQDSDVDADGDEDDEPTATSSTLPPRPPARNVPILGRAEDLPELSSDVFLSSSIDGAIMIWDRRIEGDGKGGVRRLDSSKNGGWCSSVRRLPLLCSTWLTMRSIEGLLVIEWTRDLRRPSFLHRRNLRHPQHLLNPLIILPQPSIYQDAQTFRSGLVRQGAFVRPSSPQRIV